jgi:hypothetical protein
MPYCTNSEVKYALQIVQTEHGDDTEIGQWIEAADANINSFLTAAGASVPLLVVPTAVKWSSAFGAAAMYRDVRKTGSGEARANREIASSLLLNYIAATYRYGVFVKVEDTERLA